MRMYLSINDILAGETDAQTLKKLKFVRKLLVKQKEKNDAFLVYMYGTDCKYIFTFFHCLKFYLHFVCIDLLLT